MQVEYTKFGKTKIVEAEVRVNNWPVKDNEKNWDSILWVERGEDEYVMMSSEYKDKRILIIDRNNWLKGIEV